MFASMRRYRLQADQSDEFVRRVDETFADRIAAQPGFVSYVLIDCGEGDLFTLSLFAEAGQALVSPGPVVRPIDITRNPLPDDRIAQGRDPKGGDAIQIVRAILMPGTHDLIAPAIADAADGAFDATPDGEPAGIRLGGGSPVRPVRAHAGTSARR